MATKEQCEAFIAEIGPIIQRYAKSMGYHVASPIIAQACCESAYGTSWISKDPYWNLFGMKCGSSWKGRSVSSKTKEEYTAGTLTSITANFRAYDNIEAGIAGYFSFISASRYAALKSCTNPRSYLDAIKAAGYATSSTYVNTNMAIVDKWNLTQWDWEEEKVPDDLKVCRYINGSTKEMIYADSRLKTKIGQLDPREACTCFGICDGKAVVLYKTADGHKVGFAQWTGGVKA